MPNSILVKPAINHSTNIHQRPKSNHFSITETEKKYQRDWSGGKVVEQKKRESARGKGLFFSRNKRLRKDLELAHLVLQKTKLTIKLAQNEQTVNIYIF